MHTNINLYDGQNQYIYVLEMSDTISYSLDNVDGYCVSGNNVVFGNGGMYRDRNVWYKNEKSLTDSYIPLQSKIRSIKLYFPEFSIETYRGNISYALTLSTWICGHEIVLGTYIINRIDALASDSVKLFYNNRYYECVEVKILDPWSIMYADEWKEFRKEVCYEKQLNEYYTLNSVGSILNASLYPVECGDGGYINITDCSGGQNSLKLSVNRNDFMNLNLSSNVNDTLTTEPSFICDLRFNDVYNGSLQDYIYETYQLEFFSIRYGLAIGNENELYGVFEGAQKYSNHPSKYVFKKSDLKLEDGSYIFPNGQGWKEGINITASVDIINSDGESVLYLLSNSIPLTKDIFRYFCGDFFTSGKSKINNINLDVIDMYTYNINCTNKIEQKIVQLNRPSDSKSNIISPVFYSNQELDEILVHPEVTENICINLDKYKSKVDAFTIQIEGCQFNEIGKTPSGVLFKIPGNILPGEKTSGTYYVLDQNGEMITCGKYNYVS